MTGHNEYPTEVINCKKITIGDGANEDGSVLLNFNMDRDWNFQQVGTGASAALTLVDNQPSKNFVIKASGGATGGDVTISPGTVSSSSPHITITDTKDNATAYALKIDRDGNSASKVVGMRLEVDNAGAGGVIGIDCNAFTAGEALLKVPASAITSAGTLSHQIAIDIGGTIYYLYAYTAGS